MWHGKTPRRKEAGRRGLRESERFGKKVLPSYSPSRKGKRKGLGLGRQRSLGVSRVETKGRTECSTSKRSPCGEGRLGKEAGRTSAQ